MTINVGGIIAIVIFYLLILAVGIWAAKKKPEGDDDADDVMLAGRSIGVFVGIFTMTGKVKGRQVTREHEADKHDMGLNKNKKENRYILTR